MKAEHMVVVEVIPASVQNKDAQKWVQRRIAAIATENNIQPEAFEYVAEFMAERGRVLHKPLGRIGVGGIN